ncbi:MAG TPA: subclass B3 metallo-beta-lactamase [Steroidobacteraceae bacterium]
MPIVIRTLLLSLAATSSMAFTPARAQDPPNCPKCEQWNLSQQPFQIYGNTYYVGVRGLSSILITSPQGHVLIDGDLAESAPKIVANIRTLGFRIEDVKLILNSHVHYDHAGGIAQLHELSGAKVAGSPFTARALESGRSGPDDPQYEIVPPIQKVTGVQVLQDGETLHVGTLALTAHFTPGHTPGGTTWTWQSCEKAHCLNMVYADSLSAISADSFRFTDSKTYPTVRQDFEKSFATLNSLPCDILITPHPEISDMWERLEKRQKGDANAFVDTTACKRFAATSRENLAKRLASEAGKH